MSEHSSENEPIETPPDDTEGHGYRMGLVPDEEDTEGHVFITDGAAEGTGRQS